MKHHLTPLDATQLDSWRALAAHRQELQDFRMRQAFIEDPERFKRFSFSACGLFLDFSKNLIRQDTIDLLVKLAEEARLSDAIRAMFDGEAINPPNAGRYCIPRCVDRSATRCWSMAST